MSVNDDWPWPDESVERNERSAVPVERKESSSTPPEMVLYTSISTAPTLARGGLAAARLGVAGALAPRCASSSSSAELRIDTAPERVSSRCGGGLLPVWGFEPQSAYALAPELRRAMARSSALAGIDGRRALSSCDEPAASASSAAAVVAEAGVVEAGVVVVVEVAGSSSSLSPSKALHT